MKILMICDFYVEELAYQDVLFAKYFAKEGHSVSVITSTYTDHFEHIGNRKSSNNIESSCTGIYAKIFRKKYNVNIAGKIKSFRGLGAVLRSECPDIIFLHGISFDIFVISLYLNSYRNVRLIVDLHADYINSAKNWISLKILNGYLRAFLISIALRYTNKIFTVAPSCSKFAEEVYKIPREKIELIPLAPDSDSLRQVNLESANEVRKLLNIPADVKIVFWGGKISKSKKVDLLVKSFFHLSNYYLVLVGAAISEEQDYYDELRIISESFKNIIWAGWMSQPRVYSCIMMADLCVYPTSQSVLWQQSIALGKPIIVGDRQEKGVDSFELIDVDYMFVENNIIKINPYEISDKELSNIIYSCLSNSELLASMARNSYYASENKLCWPALIDTVLSVKRI